MLAASAFAGLLAAAILVLIAMVHVYWALGGTGGKAGAIPSRDGIPVIRSSAASTLFVAVALLAMAVFVFGAAAHWPGGVPRVLARLGCATLALIFLARAVGDFRYVGVFKRVRGSTFASRDTWIYVPLCVLLAVTVGLTAVV